MFLFQIFCSCLEINDNKMTKMLAHLKKVEEYVSLSLPRLKREREKQINKYFSIENTD